MPSVYKITNAINGMCYVGATQKSIAERWKAHQMDAKKERCAKRPLYAAIQKYGADKFTVTELEECPAELLHEKEEYWIKKLNTFEHGYNATYGGAGKHFADMDLIAALWNIGKSINQIKAISGYDRQTVRKWLLAYGISANAIASRAQTKLVQCLSKPVAMIDKQTQNTLRIFPSICEAGRETHISSPHIGDCCNNRRKSAGGYIWKFLQQ